MGLVLFTDRLSEDRLSALLMQHGLQSELFYSGLLCTNHMFPKEDGVGHIHLVKSGVLRVLCPNEPDVDLHEGDLIFFPRPYTHDILRPEQEGDLEVMCASLRLGDEANNPLALSLPDYFVLSTRNMPRVRDTIALLFREGFAHDQGRQLALNNLMEYFIVQLLREVIGRNQVQAGLLATVGDKRLFKAVLAMHQQPANKWTLDMLADLAGMSRARFAHHFKDKVDMTPMDYLTSLRMNMAKNMLQQGKAVKSVALTVGYSSTAAFDRVFARQVGQTPTAWLAAKSLE